MTTHVEVVRIIDGSSLIDPESWQRKYTTEAGRALEPGYYLVTWPEDVASPAYDERARYMGPFKVRLHAQIWAQRVEMESTLPRPIAAPEPVVAPLHAGH